MHNLVGIIDIGIGNIKSISNAVNYLGHDFEILKKPSESCSHLILPGVGNFGEGSTLLTDEWRSMIYSHVKKGNLIMGICLGMQLLFNSSEESTGNGLGLLSGKITILKNDNKDFFLPRIGWRLVSYPENYKGILGTSNQKSKYYFVHSYGLIKNLINKKIDFQIVEEIQDNLGVAASVEKENIIGVQYHPEKSGLFGLDILKNFIEK